MIKRRRVNELEYGYVCLFYVNNSNQPVVGYVGKHKNTDGYNEVFFNEMSAYANVFDYWISLSDVKAHTDEEYA